MSLIQPPPRKIFASMMVTLDGFIEGPNRELDWHDTGPEFADYCDDMLSSIDLIILGRVAYQMMIEYWPAAETNPRSPRELGFAKTMNRLAKVVPSRTLTELTWNARVIKDHVADEILALKRQPGANIAVFGGAGVIATLMQHRLIDEYRIIVNPVVLGSGRPLFQVPQPVPLRLTRSTTLASGTVILYYEPVRS